MWHQPLPAQISGFTGREMSRVPGIQAWSQCRACSAGSSDGLCLKLTGCDGRRERGLGLIQEMSLLSLGHLRRCLERPERMSLSWGLHQLLLWLPVGIRAAAPSQLLCPLLAPPEGAPASSGCTVYFQLWCYLLSHACTPHSAC